MYHFPDYILAIHADRLREAEAARRFYACLSRRKRRPFAVRRRVKRLSRARVHSPA